MAASYRSIFVGQVQKDLLQHGRKLGPALTPLLFFAVVVAMFPLAMSPDPRVLATIAGTVVWVAALLATLLSMQSLFRNDFEDGSLELMMLSEAPMWYQVLAKQVAHWLVSGLPLVVLGPIAAYSLNLPAEAYSILLAALLLGTLTLSAFGAVGAALTVSIGQSGLLFAVLVLPLIVPMLIIGARATELAAAGADTGGAIGMMGAITALAFCLTPFATAAAVQVSLE